MYGYYPGFAKKQNLKVKIRSLFIKINLLLPIGALLTLLYRTCFYHWLISGDDILKIIYHFAIVQNSFEEK